MPCRAIKLVSLTSSASTFALSVHRAGDLFVAPRPADGRLELHDRSRSDAGPIAWRAGGRRLVARGVPRVRAPRESHCGRTSGDARRLPSPWISRHDAPPYGA